MRSIWRRKRVPNDTQVGFERREGIVGDLGLCSGNDRKERAFARVREPHQSHVSQHLQFENESSLLTILARLRVTRSLVGRGLEMPVSQSAPAALEQDELFAVGGHLSGIFRRTVLKHPSGDRSQRYGNDDVLTVLTRGAGSGTAFAVLRELVTLVLEVDQRPILAVAAQDNMSSATAVTAVRSAEFDEFLAAEMRRPAAAMSGTGEYFHVIYKVRSCHKSCYLRCGNFRPAAIRDTTFSELEFIAAKIVQAGRSAKFIWTRPQQNPVKIRSETENKAGLSKTPAAESLPVNTTNGSNNRNAQGLRHLVSDRSVRLPTHRAGPLRRSHGDTCDR